MFDFDQRPRLATKTDATKVPTNLLLAAILVVGFVAVLLLDESFQFDSAKEHASLQGKIDAVEGAIKEVEDRRTKLTELDATADKDPAIVHKERLPPLWKLPISIDSVEEWHKVARRRIKRADEELLALRTDEQRLKTEFDGLPPSNVKRVSFLRRLLHAVLGDLPKDPDQED